MSKSFFDQSPMGYSFDDLLLAPCKSKVASREEVDISSEIISGIKQEIPIISANMGTITESLMINTMCDMGANGILHRFMSLENLVDEIWAVSPKNRTKMGISVGVNKEDIKRVLNMLHQSNYSLPFVVVDVAHGSHESVIEAIRYIKRTFPTFDIIVGNICTGYAATELAYEGVSAVKVGVGPGSVCTTRIVTGCGYPQLSAIKNVSESIKEFNKERNKNIKVIADGGIRYSGDIVKSLAAGADTVMLGGLLAGTKETPGSVLTIGHSSEKKVKLFEGMASIDAQINHFNKDKKKVSSEGVAMMVPYKGTVVDIINNLVKGIKSGFSYCGSMTLEELQEYGKDPSSWVRMTQNGFVEGMPHGMKND